MLVVVEDEVEVDEPGDSGVVVVLPAEPRPLPDPDAAASTPPAVVLVVVDEEDVVVEEGASVVLVGVLVGDAAWGPPVAAGPAELKALTGGKGGTCR